MSPPKFPRIPHLPWSPGGTRDDRRLTDVRHLIGVSLVMTEKLDGSQLCMTRDGLFARSHNGPPAHPSFDYAKQMHGWLKNSILPEMEIYGEFCYALHSIYYPDMHEPFFRVFAMRNAGGGWWWDWDHTVEIATALGLPTVPLMERNTVESAEELERWTTAHAQGVSCFGPEQEGIVVRTEDGFFDSDFSLSIAKWVRADHVQTDEHWTSQPIVKQGSRKEAR